MEHIELDVKPPIIRFGPGTGGQFHTMPIGKDLPHDLVVMKRLTNPAPTDWVLLSREQADSRPSATRRSTTSSTTCADAVQP